MATLLDDALVTDALHGLDGWSGDAARIARTVTVGDPDALCAAVAETADAMDHHPVVERAGDEVTFTLWTHSKEGVTELDIALASRIDDIVHATRRQVRDAVGKLHDEPSPGAYPAEPPTG